MGNVTYEMRNGGGGERSYILRHAGVRLIKMNSPVAMTPTNNKSCKGRLTSSSLNGVSDPFIAPLRVGLAVQGLTADGIGILSIHDTSTGKMRYLERHVHHYSLKP